MRMIKKEKFQTVDEYIKTFPEDVQIILENIRQTIRKQRQKLWRLLDMEFPPSNLKEKI